MKSVYAVVCNPCSKSILQSRLFGTKDKARMELAKIADELKAEPAVAVVKVTEDIVSYLFGWEEKEVNYYITELEVN